MAYLIKVLDEHQIPYLIIKKNLKRLSIRFNDQGILEIKQPYLCSDTQVIKFIEDHLDWIINHLPTKPMPHESYHDGDDYLLLGKYYLIEIVYSNYETVKLVNDKIYIYTRYDKHIEKLLDNFRTEQAEVVFNEILYKCFLVMQKDLDKYPNLIIKKSKSKWGCCYHKENKIMLNISLIHVDLPLIEYVIYHELAHFIHHNHSKEFHQYLRKYLPDENIRRRALKEYSPVYK